MSQVKVSVDLHWQVTLVALYRGVTLQRAVHGAFATERPLETIRKEKGILPGSEFLPRHHMTLAVESIGKRTIPFF